MSGTVFATIYAITRFDPRYPCAAPAAASESEAVLARAFGRPPGEQCSDGVVPIRSQIWGDLVWAGYGYYLDVIGHFRDDVARKDAASEDAKKVADAPPHVDWLFSGSAFGRSELESFMDSVASGLTVKGARAPRE